MPLPAGFVVNGSTVKSEAWSLPPRGKKMVEILEKLPLGEVLTSQEVSIRIGGALQGGSLNTHPGLHDYREKIDGRVFWGSKKSIAKLRKQLGISEEFHDQGE